MVAIGMMNPLEALGISPEEQNLTAEKADPPDENQAVIPLYH
jgi:hypothetical protein